MAEELSFAELIQRVRKGDADATARLWTEYESAVRRVARIRLLNSRLTRLVDSVDICQSVMATFFKRMARDENNYEVATPGELIALLGSIARNKVTDKVRRQHTGRRDRTREEAGLADVRDFPAREATPSWELVVRELADKIKAAMTEEERQIQDLRNDGKEWKEIAEEIGGTAEGLRKKLERAWARIRTQQGLEEFADA
jgi:RNA polymerase sigma factor (sigma-70 family)